MRAAFALPFLFAGAADAAPALSDVQVGIFCKMPAEAQIPAPETTVGFIWDPLELPEITWKQSRVPAVPGVSFGMRGRAAKDSVAVTVRVTHPPFRGSNSTEEVWSSTYYAYAESANYYSLEHDYELVTGDWRIEVTDTATGKSLFRSDFVVVPPYQAPHIAKACGTGNWIS